MANRSISRLAKKKFSRGALVLPLADSSDSEVIMPDSSKSLETERSCNQSAQLSWPSTLPLTRTGGYYYINGFYKQKAPKRSPRSRRHHVPGRFLSTLRDRARSIATVTTFCGLSSFTTVVTDADGETAVEGGGIGARSSIVEKLLNVDLSRLEDGDML